MSEYQAPPSGLPGALPQGERLLWQGSPHWSALARRTFHGRSIAIYFAILLGWVVIANLVSGATPAATGMAFIRVAPLAAGVLGLILLLSWLTARSTIYSITSRRVVMRIGIALPMTLNLPFTTIASAGMKQFANGSADIPLAISGKDRIAYLMLWPHARPWRFSQPEPMLRAVPDGAMVAGILARALAAAAAQPLLAVAATSLGPKHGPVQTAAAA